MKVSLHWIRELLPRLRADAAEIAQRLTRAGLEVETVHHQAKAFERVVAVEVKKLEPHPAADKLRLVTVWDGQAERRIVCGAPNVAVAQRVPLAQLGAQLANGLQIAPREIRGVASEGMLCSAAELGLSADHDGLLLLGPEARPGRPLAELLGMDDVILDLALPANRPDLLSHLGVARELAALSGLELPELEVELAEAKERAADRASVEIADLERCPRYLGRVLEDVRVGPSPAWLVRRLEACGVRSISNVVDATNLVLMELGHPLHAFDLERLAGAKIVVRRAGALERMRTLDGVERALDADDLVIADAERPVALAGVMGGGDSEVGPGTTRVLLECALFEPRGVRRTGKRHALHTEASHRFERGADPAVLGVAMDRCAALIAELSGARVLRGVVGAGKARPRASVVGIRPERASMLLGRKVDKAEIKKVLGALGLERAPGKAKKKDGAERYVVPSWRLDLAREVDLIDELARVRGFDAIPTLLPGAGGEVRARPVPRDPEAEVRAALVAEGYLEAISLAFASPAALDAIGLPREGAVELANPLGEESALLRPSLLPALLRAARHNQSVSRTDLRLFELGRVFRWGGGELPEEEARVGVLLRGPRGQAGWWGGRELADVLDLKGTIEALLEAMGVVGARFASSERPYLHPRASGVIACGDRELGVFGELHPDVAKRLELEGPPVFVAELSVERLAAARGPIPQMRALPRFPAVTRDLSFFVDRAVGAEAITACVARAGGAGRVELFDVYEGRGVPEGQRSVAVSMEFRAPDRTLKDAEVDARIEAVMKALEGELAARVRKG